MRTRAAQVQTVNGRSIFRPSYYRAHEEQLLKRQVAVKDVSFGQSIRSLKIERRQHLFGDD
jgi:hypothetical protein